MKRCKVLGFIVGMVLTFASVAMTGEDPGSGIQNTCHDLRSGAVGAGTAMEIADPRERICFYCHTPHRAMTPAEAAAPSYAHYPIWSHAATIASFQTYSSGTDTIGQPGRVSRVCLSCHDGSVATSVYGYVPPVAIGTESRVRKASGTFSKINDSMNNGLYDSPVGIPHHHPIGFDYNDVVAKDEEIKPATSSLRGANVYGMTIEDLLWSGRLECSSCHDVHNTKNEGSKLTWVEDGLSNLCFTCHNK